MDSSLINEVVSTIRERLGKTWDRDSITMMGQDSQEALLANLHNFYGFDLTWDEWLQCVHKAIELDKLKIRIKEQSARLTVSDPNIRLDLSSVTDHPYWDQYSEYILSEYGMESSEMIKASCENILMRLSLDSPEPIKGLIHGSVQSGKTANMEGLISLAADYGFNVFIVFTGNVTSLNTQTFNRFNDDLQQRGKYVFQMISTDSKKERFNPNSRSICITMKTNARIKKIIRWLTNDPELAKQYRILIIDDEADYASINTSPDGKPPSGTNKFFRYLVNGKDIHGVNFGGKYGSMNYIAFTATPYANLLNEDDEESLYPRSFISSIVTSPKYFGPQQIFGVHTLDVDYPGLPIYISSESLDNDFKRFESGNDSSLPEELKESLAWFISATAALRTRGFKKPLTMMVNTSPNTDPHLHVGTTLLNYIETERKDLGELFEYCRIVYERECSKFNKTILKTNYPDYWGSDYEEYQSSIIEYPSFDEIVPELQNILSLSCRKIELDENSEYTFYDGLQLCLENSKKNTIQVNDEYQNIGKVKYPSKDVSLERAPAFIVIGGNILSRGLTLEGLISTFFYRPVKQADTLMQMGRWFGYRPRYELFPRIWLSGSSVRDFQYLARLDELLKEEIRSCNEKNLNPGLCAIRLLAIPAGQQLRGEIRSHSSKNKEKKIKQASISYCGRYEEFCSFNNDLDQLNYNIDLVRSFLNSLPTPDIPTKHEDLGWNVIRWKNVPSSILLELFVSKFKYGIEKDDINPQYKLFIQWLQSMVSKDVLPNWTILLAGIDRTRDEDYFVVNDKVRIGKVNRAKMKRPDPSIIEIKTLRNKSDLFKDKFPSEFENTYILNRIKQENFSKDSRKEQRREEEIINPLLIIYCIDKDSKPRPSSKDPQDIDTTDLNAVSDVVAYLIEVPDSDEDDDSLVSIDLDYIRLDNGGEDN